MNPLSHSWRKSSNTLVRRAGAGFKAGHACRPCRQIQYFGAPAAQFSKRCDVRRGLWALRRSYHQLCLPPQVSDIKRSNGLLSDTAMFAKDTLLIPTRAMPPIGHAPHAVPSAPQQGVSLLLGWILF